MLIDERGWITIGSAYEEHELRIMLMKATYQLNEKGRP
jgi:hypothetical protein